MSKSDQLRRAMEAPIVRIGDTPDTAENYASMVPDYMDDLLAESRAEERKVVDISDARVRKNDHPANAEGDDEDAREARG